MSSALQQNGKFLSTQTTTELGAFTTNLHIIVLHYVGVALSTARHFDPCFDDVVNGGNNKSVARTVARFFVNEIYTVPNLA